MTGMGVSSCNESCRQQNEPYLISVWHPTTGLQIMESTHLLFRCTAHIASLFCFHMSPKYYSPCDRYSNLSPAPQSPAEKLNHEKGPRVDPESPDEKVSGIRNAEAAYEVYGESSSGSPLFRVGVTASVPPLSPTVCVPVLGLPHTIFIRCIVVQPGLPCVRYLYIGNRFLIAGIQTT